MTTLRDRLNTAIRRVPSWTIYIASFFYVVWLFYLGMTGGLGPEPINALERVIGLTALKFVVVGLAITPLRKHLKINLIKHRRAIGVTAFFLVMSHLLVWLLLDVQSLERIWADIVKRPYITVGMLGFVMMLPLGVTSNNWSVRKLGPLWRRLHKLTYAVAILGGLHFVMLAKGFQLEPVVYLGLIAGLLLLRIKRLPRLKLA
ncbi:MAG: protein-methionine-sulfoxide reductase heme-binding subunit MsrQ [Paracoccaceae bacterium]|nr:protein-methionine-sulfoxide reductase heme-binding subunit MsrQ [Paracoccaceae bacterium]